MAASSFSSEITYFAVSDGVVLGTVAPEEAGAQIQAAIDSYLANQ